VNASPAPARRVLAGGAGNPVRTVFLRAAPDGGALRDTRRGRDAPGRTFRQDAGPSAGGAPARPGPCPPRSPY